MSSDDTEITRGSSNVFADLGLANPDQRLLKARLMLAINSAVDQLRLNQTQAAELVGLKQSELSRISNGRGAGFSTDRLLDVLLRLGRDVEIGIASRSDGSLGEISLLDRSTHIKGVASLLPGDHEIGASKERSRPTPAATDAVRISLDHARELLESSRLLQGAARHNIAYHLATLALEEVGRSELLGLQLVAATRLVEPAWPKKHAQNHVQKLFWAFFGAAFADSTLTAQALKDMQELARFIHSRRLASLYVDIDDDGVSIPSREILTDEAENLINLCAARLEISESRGKLRTPNDSDIAMQQWFLHCSDDDNRREFIFSAPSMQKLAELKSARSWIVWLKAQFDDVQAQGIAIARAELARSQSLPTESHTNKWKIQIRILSDSHSVRPKAFAVWNSRVDQIKLTAVSNKKNQLLVDLYFTESMPIEGLWHTGWGLARKFVLALNMGTKGFWWWHLPTQVSRYYESIEDLARKQSINVERSPRLKIDWGQNALGEEEMGTVMFCMAALPNAGDTAPFDYYIAGLNFLSLNDVHWQCEDTAYGNFHESLKAMMRQAGDSGKGTFDSILLDLLKSHFALLGDAQIERFCDLAAKFEAKSVMQGQVTLSDVACIKVLCDSYFIGRLAPLSLEARRLAAAGPE